MTPNVQNESVQHAPTKKPLLFVLNGPKGSGKDTAARVLRPSVLGLTVVHEKLSNPMKRGVQGIFCVPHEQEKVFEQYPDMKDQVMGVFLGASYRRVQIDLFERYLKATYGEDVLGQLLLQRLNRFHTLNKSSRPGSDPVMVVLSDSGVPGELDPLLPHYTVHIIQITRPGHDFSGDIRGYIEYPEATMFMIANDGSRTEFEGKVLAYVEKVLDEEGVQRRFTVS